MMDDKQWLHLEQRIAETEKDIRGRIDVFERHVSQMTGAMSDIRDALLGDLKNSESLGLIASHRRLRDEFSAHQAELARWRSEDADPAIKDVLKFKIQVGVISSIVVIAWTVLVKLVWK